MLAVDKVSNTFVKMFLFNRMKSYEEVTCGIVLFSSVL